jgi:hypothetical protein
MLPATIEAIDPVINKPATELSATPKWKRGKIIEEHNTPNKLNLIKLQALLLPSELPLDLHSTCHPSLGEIESKMQDAVMK